MKCWSCRATHAAWGTDPRSQSLTPWIRCVCACHDGPRVAKEPDGYWVKLGDGYVYGPFRWRLLAAVYRAALVWDLWEFKDR